MRFLSAYYPQVAVGAAIVLVVGIGAALYGSQQRRAAERASQMLLMAQTRQQWEEFIKQHPRAAVAPIARLALAAGQYEEGAYDQAAATYDLFLKQFSKHPMAPTAVLGKILCREARGDAAAALEAFEQFAAERPGHFLEPQALFGKARCLQRLGRDAEARAVYEDFIAAHPQSAWAAQAEFAKNSLDRERRARRADGDAAPR